MDKTEMFDAMVDILKNIQPDKIIEILESKDYSEEDIEFVLKMVS